MIVKTLYLSVPSTFDNKMINYYRQMNNRHKRDRIRIREVYGSLPANTARESSRLLQIDIEEIIEYAEKLAAIDIDFNYALNSTVVDGREIKTGIKSLIEKILNNNIKTITVSSTFLLSYIKENYPSVNLVLSTIAGVDSISKIKQAKKFGVKRVILDLKTTRNFQLLKNIHGVKDVEYEIMVNEFCGDCLMRNTHYNLQSQGNADMKLNKKVQYPYDICGDMFMSKKADILKGYWVLPEWMGLYGEYGIKWFKITGRTIKDIEWHQNVIKKYMGKKVVGNILELAPLLLSSKVQEGKTPEFVIDSSGLHKNRYLIHFINKSYNCNDMCSIDCNYCDDLARKL